MSNLKAKFSSLSFQSSVRWSILVTPHIETYKLVYHYFKYISLWSPKHYIKNPRMLHYSRHSVSYNYNSGISTPKALNLVANIGFEC